MDSGSLSEICTPEDAAQSKKRVAAGSTARPGMGDAEKHSGHEPVLQFFDPNCETRLSSDASKDGFAAVLLQRHQYSREWKPMAYASRALSDAETRYAQIEKELLGIVFTCERFQQYIYGATVGAETDHKPLVSTFQKPLTAPCASNVYS